MEMWASSCEVLVREKLLGIDEEATVKVPWPGPNFLNVNIWQWSLSLDLIFKIESSLSIPRQDCKIANIILGFRIQ